MLRTHMDTILSDDDIVHMLSNDQLTAAQESALIVQLAAELTKTNYDDDESYLDEPPMEIITPSETGQGTHKRWVYPPKWEDIMGDVIDSVICDSHCQETIDSDHDDIPFHLLLPHSHFDMSPLPDTNPLSDILFSPSCPPLFSDPFPFSENFERLMTPRSSSAVASVPSAPKRPYRTSKALTKGENGEMEDDGLGMGIDFDELGDDYECLNTPPRLLWERNSSMDSARVAGDDQDNDPFL